MRETLRALVIIQPLRLSIRNRIKGSLFLGEQVRGGCERGALTMCALEKPSQFSLMRYVDVVSAERSQCSRPSLRVIGILTRS